MVDQLISVFMSFVCQMQIHHGGFQAVVSQVSLDSAQVDAGFEEMCGVRVPQSMYTYALLLDAGLKLGFAEGALNAAFSHWALSIGSSFAISSQRGKDQMLVTMRGPMASQKVKSGVW